MEDYGDEVEFYDESEAFEDELKPVLSELYRICGEHKIPFVLAVSVICAENGYTMVQSLHEPSRGRTPDHFYAAQRVLMDSEGKLVRIVAEADDEDDTEDVPELASKPAGTTIH